MPDPRADNARHELLEVLFIALAATLCGAEGPSDMATFGQSKEGLLRLVLQLQHGVPSHDTFSRVFRLLDPQAFEAAFRRFMAGFAKANGLELRGVVAVDGKALRGAFERGRQSTPLHMVNVWAAEARMCLAQRKAPGRNEAAGALEVLGLTSGPDRRLYRSADALHCATLPPPVLERGADYVLALKENQSKIVRCGRSALCAAPQRRSPLAVPLAKACRQTRHSRSLRRGGGDRPARYHFRRGQDECGGSLRHLARHAPRRHVPRSVPGGASAQRPRLLAECPLLSNHLPVRAELRATSVALGDREPAALRSTRCRLQRGRNRTRKDNAPENLAILRKLALNLVRSHPAATSLRQKIKRAGWDDAFLLGMLGHMR